MTIPARNPPPELSGLRAFLLTARLGSTAAAAGELGVSAPAVSTSIRRLEASLGLALFDRSSRPMRITAAGRHLRIRAEPLLEGIDSLAGDIGNIVRTAPLDVRFGFCNSFSACVAPLLLPRVIGRIENFTSHCGGSLRILERFEKGESDIAVATRFPSDNPAVSGQVLLSENFLVVTPKEFAGRVSTLRDLGEVTRALPLIRYNDETLDRIHVDRALHQLRYRGSRTIAIDTHRTAMSLISAGSGWTVMPPMGIWMARDCLGGAAIHRLDAVRATRTYFVMHREEPYAAVSSLIHKEARAVLADEIIPGMNGLNPVLAAAVSLS